MTKDDIKTIIELFISWNGETECIDIANLPSAVEYISGCLGVNDGAIPSDFDAFWLAYDKMVGRKKAEALWSRLSKHDREAAMAYLPAYKAAQPDKRYRKDPATFLRNRGWEDEIIDHANSTHHAPLSHSTEKLADSRKAEVRELSRLATAGAAALAGLVGSDEVE